MLICLWESTCPHGPWGKAILDMMVLSAWRSGTSVSACVGQGRTRNQRWESCGVLDRSIKIIKCWFGRVSNGLASNRMIFKEWNECPGSVVPKASGKTEVKLDVSCYLIKSILHVFSLLWGFFWLNSMSTNVLSAKRMFHPPFLFGLQECAKMVYTSLWGLTVSLSQLCL